MVEAVARQKAISEMKDKLLKIENLMHTWEKTHPHITLEERSSILMKVEDVYRWMSEKEHAQNEIDPSMDPIFTSEEVLYLSRPIESLIATLKKKPRSSLVNEEKNNEHEINNNQTTDNHVTPANTSLDNSYNATGEIGSSNITNSTPITNKSAGEKNKSDEL